MVLGATGARAPGYKITSGLPPAPRTIAVALWSMTVNPTTSRQIESALCASVTARWTTPNRVSRGTSTGLAMGLSRVCGIAGLLVPLQEAHQLFSETKIVRLIVAIKWPASD